VQWIFEQARKHHVDEQEQSRQEPGQVSASHNTEQYAHHVLETVSMSEPVNNGPLPVTNGDLFTQELQLKHLGRPQEEKDEEEQVEILLDLQEPDTMEEGSEEMEQDTGDLDNVPSEPAELVGPKDGETRGAQEPGSVNPLEDGFQNHCEQVDVPIPDSRHDTSVSETQSSQPECHDLSGQVAPDTDLHVLVPKTLEFPKPDCALVWNRPAANDRRQLEQEEAPGSTYHDTGVSSQGGATRPSSSGGQTEGDSSALYLHSKQPDSEERDRELDTEEGQHHWEVAGASAGVSKGDGERPRTDFADIGFQDIPQSMRGVEEIELTQEGEENQHKQDGVTNLVTNVGSNSISGPNPELAVTSNLAPKLQAWVSSQVDKAREQARDAVCLNFFFFAINYYITFVRPTSMIVNSYKHRR
jgi:hypothetical protein